VGTESSPHTWRWRFARQGKYNRLGLDRVTRNTLNYQGAGIFLPAPLPHGECGVWGKAPQVKFRVGVRLPFSKGKEDWGAVRRRRGKAPFP